MEQKQCGKRKSPSCSQTCVIDPMIASATLNAHSSTQKDHICGYFPDQISFEGFRDSANSSPFLVHLAWWGLKLAGFKHSPHPASPKKAQHQSTLIKSQWSASRPGAFPTAAPLALLLPPLHCAPFFQIPCYAHYLIKDTAHALNSIQPAGCWNK